MIMERKMKKLQLRKETIAVLNSESMSQIIGGVGGRPVNNQYDCLDNEEFDPQRKICIGRDILIGITSMFAPGPFAALCLALGITINYCPSGECDTGYVKCPTKPYCD